MEKTRNLFKKTGGKRTFHARMDDFILIKCSKHHTIMLISHTCKIMLTIFQARLQQYMN